MGRKRVDSNLEKLLAIQTLQKGGGLSENLNSPEEEFSEELLRAPSDNCGLFCGEHVFPAPI